MSEKVYIVVTKFFPRPGDWRGAYLLDFVRAISRVGRVGRVEVFVEGDGSDYEVEGIKVHTFRTRYLPSNIFPSLFKRWNQRSFIEKVKVVGQGQQWTLDDVFVCHAHTANFGIYAEAMKRASPKCKTLLHHHDLQSFGLNMGALRHCWLYNLIQFPILRRMHEKIDTHVFISEAARRSFLAAPDTRWTQYEDYKKQMRWLPYRPVKIKDSIILHNGVDKKIFNAGACGTHKVGQDLNAYAPQKGFPSGLASLGGYPRNTAVGISTSCPAVFTIGCVGNFSELKDQLGLLKAVQILSTRSTSLHGKKLKVVFVGSGETLEDCKRFAAENGLDVEFGSEVKHEQLADFYRGLDLFVLPSTFEGFGCVYTEAHSCGVPFIACSGQGTDDLIPEEDRDKWLCQQGDPEDLARKIEDCIGRIERGERVEQRLNEDQDIEKLVGRFVEGLV